MGETAVDEYELEGEQQPGGDAGNESAVAAEQAFFSQG